MGFVGIGTYIAHKSDALAGVHGCRAKVARLDPHGGGCCCVDVKDRETVQRWRQSEREYFLTVPRVRPTRTPDLSAPIGRPRRTLELFVGRNDIAIHPIPSHLDRRRPHPPIHSSTPPPSDQRIRPLRPRTSHIHLLRLQSIQHVCLALGSRPRRRRILRTHLLTLLLLNTPTNLPQGRAALVAIRRSGGGAGALGRGYYKGGFEPKMTRKEAALILEMPYVSLSIPPLRERYMERLLTYVANAASRRSCSARNTAPLC